MHIVSNPAINQRDKTPDTRNLVWLSQAEWLISDADICFLKRSIVTFPCIFYSPAQLRLRLRGHAQGKPSDNTQILQKFMKMLMRLCLGVLLYLQLNWVRDWSSWAPSQLLTVAFSFFHCQRSLSFEICLCHCMLRLTLWNDIIVMIALPLVPLHRYLHYRQWRAEWTWSVCLLMPAPTSVAQAAVGVQSL